MSRSSINTATQIQNPHKNHSFEDPPVADMFARKDLEHDVLSAYQRHRRNLKKASAGSKPTDLRQPRTLQIDTEGHAADAERSVPTKSPSSGCDMLYTYANNDQSFREGPTDSRDGAVAEMMETTDRGHKAAAGEEAPHE